MKINDDLSELIGAIIGDGNLYDKRPSFVEISGDPNLDSHYFKSILVPIIEKELNYTPKLFHHSGALRLRINNKKFVLFLKGIGIPSGKYKTKGVLIPDIILSSWKNTKRCIRGIFDTDGCIHFDKRNVYRKPYPRIELHMSNHRLIRQIQIVLDKQGIYTKTSKKKNSFSLYFNGPKGTKSFLSNVGFSNLRHISRINKFYPDMISLNCANAPVAQPGRAADNWPNLVTRQENSKSGVQKGRNYVSPSTLSLEGGLKFPPGAPIYK